MQRGWDSGSTAREKSWLWTRKPVPYLSGKPRKGNSHLLHPVHQVFYMLLAEHPAPTKAFYELLEVALRKRGSWAPAANSPDLSLIGCSESGRSAMGQKRVPRDGQPESLGNGMLSLSPSIPTTPRWDERVGDALPGGNCASLLPPAPSHNLGGSPQAPSHRQPRGVPGAG